MNLFKKYKLVNNNKYANFLPRFLANLIDSLILNLPFILGIWFLIQKNTWEEMLTFGISILALVILPISLLSILYYPFFISKYGKTIGKVLVGLEIADKNKKLLSFKQAIFREYICKPISFSLIGFGFIAMLFDSHHQAWHDKLAGTYVYAKSKKITAGIIILLLLLATHAYFIFEIFNRIFFKFAKFS